MRRIIVLLIVNIILAIILLSIIPLPVLLPNPNDCTPTSSGECIMTLEYIFPSWKNIQIFPYIANGVSEGIPPSQISAAVEFSVRYFLGIVAVLSLGEAVYYKFRTKATNKL